ncbi:protein VAC14 homolog isoform X2 [Leptidea sinapis]|uniref:protein VAC14 homolog isoform X2 n=1 Tax=Leptidea sinapis TaxID=189913 RepID=UPI0021C3388D|nr:protein VAC14 homolog isoform X2 [Leptidea sinapis]
MTERDYAPLSNACVRGLCDKIYEKRKFAAVEIEKMVKDFSDANNSNQIKRLIRVLGQDLMSSTNPNVKNGALLGLSSVAVALGKGSVEYIDELTHPIMACLSESEARVRYMATEALFNVLKIGRAAALPNFPIIFDALAKLAADPEPQVKQGAELLDRLVKDIVTESEQFDVAACVPLLRERLYSRGGSARQFVVSWVCALDAAPALGLRRHLPHLLDPLLTILDDPHPELRRMCEVQLNEFLRSIKKSPSQVDFQAMINILITHAQSTEELLQSSGCGRCVLQLTAITWMKEFLALAGARLLPFASGILRAVLPCLAHADDSRRKIREIAATVNLQLTKLIGSDVTETADLIDPAHTTQSEQENNDKDASPQNQKDTEGDAVIRSTASDSGAEDDKLNLAAVVEVLTQMLLHNSVHTKVAALDWILHLYNKVPGEMYPLTDAVFSRAMGALSDGTDEVVLGAIAVLAEICSCPADDAAAAATAATDRDHDELESNPYYYKFLKALLRLLAADDALLEDRGAFIIRELCVVLPPEAVLRALARTLAGERDVRFAARLVDVLSALLLTAPELHATRRRLRAFDSQGTHALFKSLYWSWCHSPVALVALCLLTHNYTHCNKLIATFGDLEITVDFLTEVDKLVQLIESPIFAYLRLELLSGAESAALRGALFGLLMLLPQSSAFHALRHRLRAAPRDAPCLIRGPRVLLNFVKHNVLSIDIR